MDLNYYLYREQVELMRASATASPEARDAHDGMAALYRERIVRYRIAAGALPPAASIQPSRRC